MHKTGDVVEYCDTQPGFGIMMKILSVAEAKEWLKFEGESVIFRGQEPVTVDQYFSGQNENWENDSAVVFNARDWVVHAVRMHDGKFTLVYWKNGM